MGKYEDKHNENREAAIETLRDDTQQQAAIRAAFETLARRNSLLSLAGVAALAIVRDDLAEALGETSSADDDALWPLFAENGQKQALLDRAARG